MEKNNEEVIKLNATLTKEEFNILIKAIDYYSYTTNLFYAEETEDCGIIRNKIVKNYLVKGEY